jgi:hypothetical protein
VRKAARENKEMRFTSLLHHVSVDLLYVSISGWTSGARSMREARW